MLRRIYIDNFRCLVNFELRLDRIALLLGPNGSGKSSLLDALWGVQEFVLEGARVEDAFPPSSLTRWQTLDAQRFELEFEDGEDRYCYRLTVEHDLPRRKVRVREERLDLGDKPLFQFAAGMVQLYRDDHSPGPQFPFDWGRSGVGMLHERPDNERLARFRTILKRLVIVRPLPPLMEQESRGHASRLGMRMENFASWFRHISQEHMGSVMELMGLLREALPGFDTLSLKEAGEEVRLLKAQFRDPATGKPASYGFGELSDGQRMLIALYALVYGIKEEGAALCIDEPDNFVALAEIQPWLSQLMDACGEWLGQAILVSHHPEIINYLGASHGRWFSREAQGPVRVTETPADDYPGITLAEMVARGWA